MVKIRVGGRCEGGSFGANGASHILGSNEGDASRISKCVCSFVKFPLDVIELSSYSFVDVVGGMGEIFKELEEDEVIGEEVRVGGVSTILEKENDKIRVAVKNTGDRPPLKISINGKL